MPGVTTGLYDGLEFSGEGSDAELLGLFRVSVLHNVVHLLFGIAALALARTVSGARSFLIGGGAIYVVLSLLGLAGGLDWLPANRADHWLHLVVGPALVAAGVVLTEKRPAPA